MIIKDYKCKCGHDDFFFSDNGNQTGIYCSRCGMWLKWADKNEQNLRMKQEPILDKIEEEIKDTLYVDSLIFGELIDFKNGKIDADDVIEEFNRVTRLEVLRIIDKYKLESEVQNDGTN